MPGQCRKKNHGDCQSGEKLREFYFQRKGDGNGDDDQRKGEDGKEEIKYNPTSFFQPAHHQPIQKSGNEANQ